MSSPAYDVAVIGGGIVGLATAMALAAERRLSVVVLEAESRLAAHQSGNNSGIIHAGLYYKPGSLKARNCVEGREAMYRFCDEHGIRAERCGKLVVATEERELPRLDELERRGRANGLDGLERLGPEGIREREPHAAGIAGLWVPQTGVVDFGQVTRAMADVVRGAGGEILTGARVHGCRLLADGILLESVRGETFCRSLVNCAGLESDRVARRSGADPGVAIVPFRGEYYELAPHRRALVRNLVYPVPDPAFPFLGVHFTRTPTARSRPGRTPCWRSSARVTAPPTSASATSSRWVSIPDSGGCAGSTGGRGSPRCTARSASALS